MRKTAIWAIACASTMVFCLVACVPSMQNELKGSNSDTYVPASNEGFKSLDAVKEAMQEVQENYQPEIRTLEDGTQIQLTPTVSNAYWHLGNAPTSFNTYYMNADSRGCMSCHKEGLSHLMGHMSAFRHVELDNGLGTDTQITDCITCHDQGAGYVTKTYELGSLIHGIHSDESFAGNCWSCHNATSDGNGMMLWEQAKYTALQGITFISSDEFKAIYDYDFTYEQDTTTDMFRENWLSGDTNQEMIDHYIKNDPLDEDTFNNWEITVDGLVNAPFTAKLVDLIKEAPSETLVSSTQCVMNAPGGELVANVEIKGIPIKWLLEEAGIRDGATAVMATAPDGWSRGQLMSVIEKQGGYLVYEINGERLEWDKGYPCLTWYPGEGVPSYIRWTTELTVVDTPEDEVKRFAGWEKQDGSGWFNKPNAGITHLHEGQILRAGENHEFTGYAQGFDRDIDAVEVSFDLGKTWITIDTKDTSKDRWVYWHFTYTPNAPGAYVMQVRAKTDNGLVSENPDTVMFNVK